MPSQYHAFKGPKCIVSFLEQLETLAHSIQGWENEIGIECNSMTEKYYRVQPNVYVYPSCQAIIHCSWNEFKYITHSDQFDVQRTKASKKPLYEEEIENEPLQQKVVADVMTQTDDMSTDENDDEQKEARNTYMKRSKGLFPYNFYTFDNYY
jgi:hypothetical protein